MSGDIEPSTTRGDEGTLTTGEEAGTGTIAGSTTRPMVRGMQ